jgi:hypothetical protein
MMSKTAALLEKREETHGPFSKNVVAFDRLLNALPLEGFDPKERCAVAMIYMKLARLHTGQMRTEQRVDIGCYSGVLQGTLR